MYHLINDEAVLSCKTHWPTQGLFNMWYRFGRGGADFQKFYLSSLGVTAAGVTDLSMQIQSLITRSQMDLLALLFSTLPYAAGFNKHHSELHSSLGLRLDGKGATEEDFRKCGGSIEDLELFIKNSKSSSVDVDQRNPLKRFLLTNSEGKLPKKKKPSQDKQSMFEDEVKDREGVERKYSNAFCGSVDVKLESLQLDPTLNSKVRYFHVDGLKKTMLSRFDPSLISIVVRPADASTFDPNLPAMSKYYVIQGLHSFRALQLLKDENKLHLLPGMGEGFVTATIVNVEETDLVLYGHLRGNSLASTYVRKPQPQVGNNMDQYMLGS